MQPQLAVCESAEERDYQSEQCRLAFRDFPGSALSSGAVVWKQRSKMDVLSPSRVKMWSRSAEPKQVKKKRAEFQGGQWGKVLAN